MVDGLRVHRADDRDVIRDLACVGQEIADPLAALAALLEMGEALADREAFLAGGHSGEALALADGIRQILPVDFYEMRLVVEKVDVRGAAGLEKVDHAFRLGREVGGRG